MRRLVLALALLLGAMGQGQSAWAQSGVGGGGQSNVGGGGGSSSSGATAAAPVMGYYLGNNCSTSNIGKCFNSPANTQQCDGASYTSGNATVTCGLTINSVSGNVGNAGANIATYTTPSGVANIPSTWLSGQSITVVGFSGSDTFFNQTCTLSSVTATTLVCPLTHANASSTSTGEAINNAVGPFVAADAGTSKRLFGYQTCRNFFNLSTSNNLPLTTGTALTISTFISSNQVTLSGNAQSTVSSAGCIAWGNTDDAGAALVDAAMQADPQCQKLHLQSANYMFTTFHWINNPPACSNGNPLIQASLNGNIFFSGGFVLEGRDPGSANGYLTPGFPETGTCTNGLSGKACWVIPTEAKWSHWRLTGLGNYNSSNPAAGPYLVEVNGPATLEDFVADNWGAGIGTGGGLANDSICVYAEYWVQIQQVNISGCGAIHYAQAPGSYVNATRLSADNPRVWGIAVGVGSTVLGANSPPNSYFENYNLVCYECRGFAGNNLGGTAPATLVNQGQSIKLYHSAFTANPNTLGGAAGYAAITNNGSLLDAEDTIFDFGPNATPGSTPNNNIAVECIAVTCTNIFKGVTLSASATGGKTYTDTVGSTFRNLGNVTVSGAAGLFTPAGTTFATPQESGTVTCAASAATITFKATYLFNPLVVIQDQTTAGVVTQTTLSTTTKVVACPGATDVLLYTVTPNPV